VTGPGGTGKSFLLKALEAWCNRSRNQALLLAPTGIAANSISGATIHSALALFSEGTSYRSGVLATGHDRRAALRRVKVLIIDEISMVDSQLLEFVSATFSKIHNNAKPFGNLHVVVLGDLMQLPPVTGYKVFYSPLWRLFHPLFLEQPQRQVRDLRFFRILNKIRFGLIDEEVQEALTERFQQYNPAEQTYKTTFLCSLRTEAYAMNEVVLASLPTSEPTSFPYVSVARDYEGDTPITNSFHSTTFKRGTNFPDLVTCIVGAKVMFLTNGMIHKGISNGTCGVITEVLHNGEVEVAFPTKDGIQVSLSYTGILFSPFLPA
jgi:ATP-dependent exoDNAse (exonuclease V) alpha subunit